MAIKYAIKYVGVYRPKLAIKYAIKYVGDYRPKLPIMCAIVVGNYSKKLSIKSAWIHK